MPYYYVAVNVLRIVQELSFLAVLALCIVTQKTYDKLLSGDQIDEVLLDYLVNIGYAQIALLGVMSACAVFILGVSIYKLIVETKVGRSLQEMNAESVDAAGIARES